MPMFKGFTLIAALVAVPLAADAQALLYTGSLTCEALPGQSAAPAPSAVLLRVQGYRATYQLKAQGYGAVPAGIDDNGRGTITGMDAKLLGGGSKAGIDLKTTVTGVRRGREYDLAADQVFSGKGLLAAITRRCKGTAR